MGDHPTYGTPNFAAADGTDCHSRYDELDLVRIRDARGGETRTSVSIPSAFGFFEKIANDLATTDPEETLSFRYG